MAVHKQIIENLTSSYQSNGNNIALLITGSVARNEQSESSDLDLLLIAKEKQPFSEKIIEGVVVETKTNTVVGYLEKMQENPMQIYQWLDAKVIFDKNNSAEKLIIEAKKLYENYRPDPKEISGVKKWLDSARIKIKSAQDAGDNQLLGWNIANIPWTIVKGLYLLNNVPTPPSTTAFKRITKLEKLPENFGQLWEEMLTEDLQTRAGATLKLINFLTKAL